MLTEAIVYDLTGQKIDKTDAEKRLEKTSHVYLLESPRPLSIEPYFATVLDPNLLFVFHPDLQDTDALQVTKPAPPTPAPGD